MNSVCCVLLAQFGPFHRQRLLDLDDQLRLLEHLAGALGDLRPSLTVVLVGKTDGGAGLGLDPHLVPQRGQFSHGLRCEADTVLVILDFLGYADSHGSLPAFRINTLKSRKASRAAPGKTSEKLSARHCPNSSRRASAVSSACGSAFTCSTSA